MADTQKSKGTQGGSSKQHSDAGKQSHQGSSRDSNTKSTQGSPRSGGAEHKSSPSKSR